MPLPLRHYNINFVIEANQIDTEAELAEGGETLPAYDTSMMDIVLDIGPEAEQRPEMISRPLPTTERRVSSHPLPPAYEHEGVDHEAIQLQPVQPPPAYLSAPTMTAISNRR